MKFIKEKEIEPVAHPGRVIQTAIGKENISKSNNMSVGFGHFKAENGHMLPHNHAEEVIYIISAKNAWIRYGPDENNLKEKFTLEPGLIIHIGDGEWHCLDFEDGGHIDLVFFYAQTNNIRPEEN